MMKMLPQLRNQAHRFLRSTERFTKTDMVYLASGGFWLAVNQIGIGLIALGLSAAFARLVPKEIYGNYRFLLSLFWIATAFSMTGVAPALMRAAARNEEGAYRVALRRSIIWSIPMTVIGLGTAFYYFFYGNIVLGWGSLTIALIGPFMQGAYLFGAYQEGKREFRVNAVSGIVLNAVPAFILLCTMPFIRDAAVFLALYLGASIATGFIISALVIKKEKPASESVVMEFKSMSKHFSVVNALATISQQIDRIFVFHYLGAIELAVYSFAVSLPEQIKGVVGSIEPLAFPKFANQDARTEPRNIWGRLTFFTFGLALVVCTYIFIAPFIFHILFPAYPEAVIYSQVFALSLIFVGGVIPATIFQAQGAKKKLYTFTIATSVFQIVILVPFILWWGLMGAVIARVVARAFNLVFGAILLKYNPTP